MQEATSRMASRQSTPANQATRVKPLPPPKNFGAKQIEICRSWNKFISNSPRSAEQKGASCRKRGSTPSSSADQRIDEPPSRLFDPSRITLVRIRRSEIVLQRPLSQFLDNLPSVPEVR